MSFIGDPGNWVGFGFSKYYTNNLTIGNGRFTDTPAGYDWLILTENTGNVQYFGGAGTANTIFGANNEFPVGPGTNTVQIVLNTRPSLWTAASYVNGVQIGTNFTYP